MKGFTSHYTERSYLGVRRVNITDVRFGDLGELEVCLSPTHENLSMVTCRGAASIAIPLQWSGHVDIHVACVLISKEFGIDKIYLTMLKRKIYKYYNQMVNAVAS